MFLPAAHPAQPVRGPRANAGRVGRSFSFPLTARHCRHIPTARHVTTSPHESDRESLFLFSSYRSGIIGTPSQSPNMGPTPFSVKVLLVDDQVMVGETVRKMLAGEPDIEYRFCPDPAAAIDTANEFHPTVILQDLVMPDIDGLQLVKYYRANPGTRDTPLVVLSSKEEPIIKAKAFALGANDYLVKLPDRLEVIARVRYHSRGYINLLERNEAYHKLAEKQRELTAEVNRAARYVQSLLPTPLTSGPFTI